MRVKEGNKEKDIIEAAVNVFAEFGFHRSKISKIAEEANVAAGSVYVYFKNKDDILQQIFEYLWKKIYLEFEGLYKNLEISSAEKIDAMIDVVFDVFSENPAAAKVFVNEQQHLQIDGKMKFVEYYEKFFKEAKEIVSRGARDGIFSNSVDIPSFRIFILGAIRNLLLHWADDPKQFPLNKIRQNVKFLIKYGIMKR